MKAVKQGMWFSQKQALIHPQSRKTRGLFGSLADYRLISLNVALKTVTQQQTGSMLMNLND